MWRSDIISVLIEVLREDYSSLQGQWSTAAELASLLGRICSSIQPKAARLDSADSKHPSGTFSEEEIEEYYDILLPTATDSFLILANSVHEARIQGGGPTGPSKIFEENLEQFKLVFYSLCRVCAVHTLCISRVIQSPYLLHLLVTDDQAYSSVVLNVLHELVSQDKRVLPAEALQSLLDELVFKIGGTDERLAMTSLSLLGLFSSSNNAVFDLICERYKGLSVLLQKWSASFDKSVKCFAETLLERVKASDEDYRHSRAAVIIQAGWRGYCSRKKMLKVKRGISKFQRLYRMKKAKKIREEMISSLNQSTKRLEEIQKIQSARECHEKQKEVLEQMPASSVDAFLSKLDRDAAVKIQSWWRGLRDRIMMKEARLNKLRHRSAVVIQRAYRRHFKRKTGSIDEVNQNVNVLSGTSIPSSFSWNLPPLTAAEREHLESDTVLSRTPRQPSAVNELSNALEWFYSTRGEAREADRRRAYLLAQV